jgi:hypothetical protein
MIPLNDNYFWPTIVLVGPNAVIRFISSSSDEKFSHNIETGVHLRSNINFQKLERINPAPNMTHSFNEVSMEWNKKKIIWKLNNQLINDVDLKKFSESNESIAQMFDNTFSLVMSIMLKEGSYNDFNFNFNLSNVHIPHLYID